MNEAIPPAHGLRNRRCQDFPASRRPGRPGHSRRRGVSAHRRRPTRRGGRTASTASPAPTESASSDSERPTHVRIRNHASLTGFEAHGRGHLRRPFGFPDRLFRRRAHSMPARAANHGEQRCDPTARPPLNKVIRAGHSHRSRASAVASQAEGFEGHRRLYGPAVTACPGRRHGSVAGAGGGAVGTRVRRP